MRESKVMNQNEMDTLKKSVLSRFQCQQSGNCCRVDGYVYVTSKEAQDMADYLKIDLETFHSRYVEDDRGWKLIASKTHRPSCFLNSCQQCEVYDVRPEHCRTYPDWPEIWQSQETLLKETGTCPGLKKAYEEVLDLSPLMDSEEF